MIPLPTSTSASTMLSLLSCANPNQLAEFCALAVPSIWGPLKQQQQQQYMKRTIVFKQFCQKVIKATQISCACVVLGLYYIHRLRSAYPYIHASIGSEIRLFTTALVLANKYLDDNTFTNKTWSEVSNIPISELNIMEMEFLSALHYNIHLPYDQYFHWVGQCQQWILPTIMHQQQQQHQFSQRQQYVKVPTTPPSLISTPIMPLTPSVSNSNLKRTYQEDDHHRPHKRSTTISLSSASSSSSTPVNTKMPYTPPESFQPMPSFSCYPTPPINEDFCRPILSWSSSSSSMNHPRYASAVSAPLHYSTSLLATRVRSLELH